MRILLIFSFLFCFVSAESQISHDSINVNFPFTFPGWNQKTTTNPPTTVSAYASTIQAIGDAMRDAYSQVMQSIPDKEALVNSIKGFNYGKDAGIQSLSDQSDAGRAEVTNFIINSINSGFMDPREVMNIGTQKMGLEETGLYLEALGDYLISQGY